MQSTRHSLRAATGIAALVLALPAAAQTAELPPLPDVPPMGDSAIDTTPVTATVRQHRGASAMSQTEINALPEEYRSLPVGEEVSTTTVDENGIETITRTRRIASRAPTGVSTGVSAYSPAGAYSTTPGPQGATYVQSAYSGTASAAMVMDREGWIDECERRTKGRDRNSTGTIIGGLLGAIGGGVLGNRVWDSERLAGTLIGGGVGGIAGALIGSLFNGRNEDDLYDCEAALSTYLDTYGQYGAPRFASRVIAAPGPAVPAQVTYQGFPAYGYGYAQAPAYYAPAPTMVMVPVTTYQQQRVIVRENVTEETYEVPGAARTITEPRPVVTTPPPAPTPSPKMIKD
jgi:hypothetical protein